MSSRTYWKRLIKLFYHYKKKSSLLPYQPIRLWVELTSACNYRCKMCPNKELKKEDRGLMSFDVYKKILDDAHPFVLDINLAHRGESLLHPQLIEAICYAKKLGFFTRLHTNGSLLTEELSEKILSSGLDRLSFSFDGYTKETYEDIRRGGNFENTLNNIIHFLKRKRAVQSKKPETALEVINMEDENNGSSKKEKEKFLSRFKSLPLDNLVIKKMHNWAGEITPKDTPHKYSACPFPWNALVICWDGAVLPCTQDFFGHYTVGNVMESSLEQIWNNKKMASLRKKLAGEKVHDLKTCSRCDRLWRRGLLGVPKEYLWRFITKRMP